MKTGKLERLKTLLSNDPETVVCPVCGAGTRLADGNAALRCAEGHSYDLARKGYVNLLGRRGGAGKGPYNPALFESRRAVFGFGHYEEAARQIAKVAGSFPDFFENAKGNGESRPIRILDAGCGEGYYSFMLSRDARFAASCRFYGLDLSRDAIAMATEYEADVVWIVGDLARPPFRDGVFDIVLDVLTPANYSAFRRILAPDGVIIKVMPGREYLKELRALRGGEAGLGGDETLAHSEKHIDAAARASIFYTRALCAEQKRELSAMTPLTAGGTFSARELNCLNRITIHLEIIAGRPR
jgi:23S rRNA (guanine745-N1)-methyltransferase